MKFTTTTGLMSFFGGLAIQAAVVDCKLTAPMAVPRSTVPLSVQSIHNSHSQQDEDNNKQHLRQHVVINERRLQEECTSAWLQVGMDIDGEAGGDVSGWSVSLSSDGMTVAIGAINNDGNGWSSGHTRIYKHDDANDNWNQMGADIDGEAWYDNSGQWVSLSSDGMTVTIGASGNDNNGQDSGHTRIYKYNDGNGNWDQMGADIDGEAASDASPVYEASGRSVSLSSDGMTVAIGASGNDCNGYNSGHTRIYKYDDGNDNWDQMGADIHGEAASDGSGRSVSLSSDGMSVAIGASRNDGNGSNSGHTRIYNYDGANDKWDQIGADIEGEAAGDESGQSVSLSSDGMTVAIGASRNDGNGSNSGHTRIYNYNGTAWNQMGADIDGEAERDVSGWSVSLSSDGMTVAIGAQSNDGNSTDSYFNSGHTRIYKYDDANDKWDQMGADIDGEAAGDKSGWSVSLSSDGMTVAIGATGNDGNGTSSGHTRIYEYYDCLADADKDNVTDVDEDPLCLDTKSDEELTYLGDNILPVVIVDDKGCSLDQICVCEMDWQNHGRYMGCINHASKGFVAEGFMSPHLRDLFVSSRAETDCGKK